MTKVPVPQSDNAIQSLALALSKAAISVVPGAGNLINEFIGKTNQRLIENGHKIFLKEITKGRVDLSEHEKEEFIPIGYRYYRAAQEGTVNRNLRLLAKLIRKQIDDEELSYEKYVTLDNAVRDLSLEEMIALSKICDRTDDEQRSSGKNSIRTSPLGKTLINEYPSQFNDLISTETTFSLLSNKGWLFLERLDDGIVGEGSSVEYRPTDMIYSIIDMIKEIDT